MQKIKKCTKCKNELPLSNFYKNKLILDGHSNYCIDCTKINSKKYFDRKREKVNQNENEHFTKMMLFSNLATQITPEKTDTIMHVLLIEKLCKTILFELDSIKKELLKTGEPVQTYESKE